MRRLLVLFALPTACLMPVPAAPVPPALNPPASAPAEGDLPPPRSASAESATAPTLLRSSPAPAVRATWGVKAAFTRFDASLRERWRSALVGYVGAVTELNHRPLDSAAPAFARYVNRMHVPIHALFSDSFLVSLDALPEDDPLNDQGLLTRLEIVLTHEGRVKKMGVVQSSGQTDFDIAALDSVDRAQPFEPAPQEILSPDGNVYMHWEFHRNEIYACSGQGIRPYILKE